MQSTLRNLGMSAWLLAGALASTVCAAAPDVVKVIVPFAAGGPADQIARIVQPALSTVLGKPVIIDNRGGVGGTLGANFVAKAPPDGGTILLSTSSLVLSAGTTPHLPYDARKDLLPVYILGEVQSMIAVRPTLGVSNLEELNAKARSTKLNYGSTGVGGTMHVGAELYSKTAKAPMVHIPYRGIAPALTDAMGGQTQAVFPGLAAALQHIRSGRMRALAVTGPVRAAQLKDVPTLDELGLKNFDAVQWYGVVGPAGIPPAVVQKLNETLNGVLNVPDMKEKLAGEAVEPLPMSAGDFGAYIQRDVARWTRLAKAQNIQLD